MDNYDVNQTPQGGAGMSIASMVLGIVALVSCCIWWISIPCGVIGIVLAVLSLKGQKPGRGMAIAGLVCAIIGLIPAILLVAFSGPITEWANSVKAGAGA